MILISDPVWLALIPTVPATLGVILGFINRWRIEENTDETREISHKTDKIHDLTNGNLTQLREEMTALRAELRTEVAKAVSLEKIVAAKDLGIVQGAKAVLEVKVMETMQENADLKEEGRNDRNSKA